MFSIKPYIGGIKLIKENNINIAWIDLYGDLQFSDDITSDTKQNIIKFLDENHIEYNTDL